MAATYRNEAHAAATGATPQTITVNVPTGVVDGDMLVAFIGCRGSAAQASCATPSGWTASVTRIHTGFGKILVFWRVASSEPASYGFVLSAASGNVHGIGGIYAAYGCDTSALHKTAVGYGGSDATAIIPSVTTTIDGCLIVGGVTSSKTAQTNGYVPATWTERWDQGAGSFMCACCDDEYQATQGATGTENVTIVGVGYWATAVVALAPSSAATYTRTITPATAALQCTLTRNVTPATSTLLRVTTRIVTPVTVALQRTLTNTVTATTALKRLGITQTVPATNALQRTLTKTAAATVALLQVKTATVPDTSAVLRVNTRTTGATSALLRVLTRSLTPTTALQQTRTRTLTPVTTSLTDGYGRPCADVTTGSWTATPLWQKLDEA